MSSNFSKDFALDAGIFKTTKLTVSGSTDTGALQSILANDKFPDGDIELGHISFSADTGKVSLLPEKIGGASMSFDIAASAQSGAGVYAKSADALKALNLSDAPKLTLPDQDGQRYLLMDWGYSASFSGSASHPLGLLGSVTFGVDTQRKSVFAVLHRFDANQGAHKVIEDTVSSWRLPRHVAFTGADLNLSPRTWLVAEADGGFAIKLATSLGWNISFAKDAKILNVTHNLSAKIDASLKASFGFSASGKYIIAAGREDDGPTVHLQLWKQSSKGLNFGLNLDVGITGADPQLPTSFDDFIKSIFGVHGLQVLKDLREWTDSSTDLGQKLAGLGMQELLDLLKTATPIDPAADFDKAKQFLSDALTKWDNLPQNLPAMLWAFLDKQTKPGADPAALTNLKSLLTNLSDPTKAAETLANALQKATFGDTIEGQYLHAIADNGLLALARELNFVSQVSTTALNLLNGEVISKLQKFINDKLNLDQIRKAVSDLDFQKIEQWLQNRLATFLDKTLKLDDLKDIQNAIRTLDTKVGDYYKTGIQALTKRYSLQFAATYQKATTDTALLDVTFDLSNPAAAALYTEVVANSHLDNLLVRQTSGVILNLATLTHEIATKSTVDVHMPFFDFTSTHVNDAIVTLTAEDQGGRLLLYQINAKDNETVKNRASSQLSILASLKVAPGESPKLDSGGTIGYEMKQVKADARPIDLEARTTIFIHKYLAGLFSGGDSSIRSFYTDLDNALTAATHNQSNHLGDIALSMQLSLDANLLNAWFENRTDDRRKADKMQMSRALQVPWKALLKEMNFTDLKQYEFNESVAALLVWSSMPISTTIDFDRQRLEIRQFNTDKDVFWDWFSVDLRRAVAQDSHTVATLAGKLAVIHAQLQEAGNKNAPFFDPSMTGRLIGLALNHTGDNFLSSLLFTESQLMNGAADALDKVVKALNTAATAPNEARKVLAQFAADLTDTFNHRVKSVYSKMSGRVVGPMLLVEATKALGGPGVTPDAMFTLQALNPGHKFDLGTFIDGKLPDKSDVALTQTLVSLT